MFCPKCAAENHDPTRFCRGCGTDLEVVALALNAELTPELGPKGESKTELTQQRLKLQGDGIREVLRGAFLFVSGILLGIPLVLFGKASDWYSNWILVWLVLCGWLPVWGAFMMGTGISNLIQLRMMERRTDLLGAARSAVLIHPSAQTQRIAEAQSSGEVAPPLSVTERTTASLNKPHPSL